MQAKTAAQIKTRFEQVPLDLVRKLAGEATRGLPGHFLDCVICGKAVELEHCKTDEYGDAVHDKCYIARMAQAKDFFAIKRGSANPA
jgi:hypothetical protein